MRKCCLCISPVALVGAIAAAIFAFIVLPSMIEKKVEKEIVLKNGTDTFDRFVNFPIPLQWKIHFFNISGWQNFDGNVSNLEYNEVGPYIYDETWIKDVQLYPEENDGMNLTYNLKRSYSFNRELSGSLSDQDVVTLINPVLAIPFNVKVDELAFSDTVDKISFNGTEKLLFSISIFTGSTKFSTQEETLYISTGKDNPRNILQILGKVSPNDVWVEGNGTVPGTCNTPRGTDGTQFHPNVQPDDVLTAYEPLICRSLTFRNKMDNVEVLGIKTLRFVLDDDNFKADKEENKCYCYPDDPQPCLDDTLPLKKCGRSQGKDIVASSPYFLTNPQLRQKVGLKAPKEVNNLNYGTIADVEPITGTTLSARKRLQLNVRLRKHPKNDLLKNLNEESVLIPLLWVEEGADLDEKNRKLLHDKIFGPRKLATISLITAMCVLVVLSVGAAAVFFFRSE